MPELPFLSLEVDALLGDTSHMTAEQFGAYCRLLFTMWLHGGKLRNEPDELARIVGMTPRCWARVEARVLMPMTIEADQITQKRLTATWVRTLAVRKKRQAAALTRWKHKTR